MISKPSAHHSRRHLLARSSMCLCSTPSPRHIDVSVLSYIRLPKHPTRATILVYPCMFLCTFQLQKTAGVGPPACYILLVSLRERKGPVPAIDHGWNTRTSTRVIWHLSCYQRMSLASILGGLCYAIYCNDHFSLLFK